jgi:hypothetical protein
VLKSFARTSQERLQAHEIRKKSCVAEVEDEDEDEMQPEATTRTPKSVRTLWLLSRSITLNARDRSTTVLSGPFWKRLPTVSRTKGRMIRYRGRVQKICNLSSPVS